MGAGKTVDDWDAWTDKMKAAHGNGNGHGKSLAIEAQRLLPTPAAWEQRGKADVEKYQPGTRHGKTLAVEASLLPTPRATDGTKGGPNQAGSSGDLMLPSAVQEAHWGQYAAAIARWEAVLGRPAPAPTEPGPKDNPRLSPRFVEWLMGLDEGWVCDTPDLTRNEQLKLLGNGVVPQQALAALQTLAAIRATEVSQ